LKHEEPQYRTHPLLSRHAVQNSWRWCGDASAAIRRGILDEKKSCERAVNEPARRNQRSDAVETTLAMHETSIRTYIADYKAARLHLIGGRRRSSSGSSAT